MCNRLHNSTLHPKQLNWLNQMFPGTLAQHVPSHYFDSGRLLLEWCLAAGGDSGTRLRRRCQASRRRQSPRRIPPCRGQGGSSSSIGASSKLGISSSPGTCVTAGGSTPFSSSSPGTAVMRAGLVVPPRPARITAVPGGPHRRSTISTGTGSGGTGASRLACQPDCPELIGHPVDATPRDRIEIPTDDHGAVPGSDVVDDSHDL